MRLLLLFSLSLLVASPNSFGQQKVAYSPDFQFKEGVYLSFQDFKNNNPIEVTHIYSELDIRNDDYLDMVLDTDSVVYFDKLLEERIVDTRSVWGFCKNNKIYIGINTVQDSKDWRDRQWFPILSIGAYSYFTATVIVTRYMPPSPSMGMGYGGMGMYGNQGFPSNGNYYDEAVNIHSLLDFSSGQLIELGTGDLSAIAPELLEQLLAYDRPLLNEFEDKSRHDQKQASMFYIREFNQRNPIYFPLSQ